MPSKPCYFSAVGTVGKLHHSWLETVSDPFICSKSKRLYVLLTFTYPKLAEMDQIVH